MSKGTMKISEGIIIIIIYPWSFSRNFLKMIANLDILFSSYVFHTWHSCNFWGTFGFGFCDSQNPEQQILFGFLLLLCLWRVYFNKFLPVTGVRGETPQETGAHERPYLSLANAHNQCVHSVTHSHTIHFLFHLHSDSEWQSHCL